MEVRELPTQEYHCDRDGAFDIHLTFAEDVPVTHRCPKCSLEGRHVLRAPASKFARTWNEQANEAQRDPYTQAKAQSENMYNEQRDMGVRLDKPTEESIQGAAAALDHSERHPKPPAHIQQRDFTRTQLKNQKTTA
jgi:hypothetical protein